MPDDQTASLESKEQYLFKVNGVQITSGHRTFTGGAILLLALEHHAIAGKPAEYLLRGEKHTYGPDQLVDLAEDNVFIAIPNRPTPVADFFARIPRQPQRGRGHGR